MLVLWRRCPTLFWDLLPSRNGVPMKDVAAEARKAVTVLPYWVVVIESEDHIVEVHVVNAPSSEVLKALLDRIETALREGWNPTGAITREAVGFDPCRTIRVRHVWQGSHMARNLALVLRNAGIAGVRVGECLQ